MASSSTKADQDLARRLAEAFKPPTKATITDRASDWLWAQLVRLVQQHLAPRIPVTAWCSLLGAPVVAFLVEALHLRAPHAWPAVVVAGGALAYGAWWRVRPSGSAHLWRARIPARWLAPGAIIAGALWTTCAWIAGLDRALLALLVLASIVGAVVAIKRGGGKAPAARRGSDPAQIVAEWDTLTGGKSPIAGALSGSSARIHDRDDMGWTLRIELVAGHTADELVAIARNIESALRLRRGALRIQPDDLAHVAHLRAIERDVLSKPVRWAEPDTASVLDPIRLGTFEDGEAALVRLVPEAGRGVSLVLAGLPGAGKSGLLNIVLAALARCADAVLAGIDPQGSELGPWEDVFEPGLLALDAGADAERVLDRLLAIMAARQQLLKARGIRYWTPSPEAPEVVLVVDEAADLARSMEALDEIVRKGRKLGVHVVMATQRPSAKALGEWGSEVISKCGGRICLRVSTVTEVNIALGPGAAGEGWRADQLLQRPGEFLVRSADAEHQVVRRARGLLMTDEDVRQWAARCAPDRPRLDDASATGEDARERE